MKPNPAFYHGTDIAEPMFLDTCEGGCGRTFNVRSQDGSMAIPSLDTAESCIDCAEGRTSRTRSTLQIQRRDEARARDLRGLMHHRGQRVCANQECGQPFRPKGREQCCSDACSRERRRQTVKQYDESRRGTIRKVPAQ